MTQLKIRLIITALIYIMIGFSLGFYTAAAIIDSKI